MAFRLCFAVLLTLPLVQSAFSVHQNQNKAGVRFSLYPNVAKEDPPSLKQAVKTAVVGLGDLGVHVSPDAVSSFLVGTEPALFEALRSCFSRACLTADGKPRGVSMQATFSAGEDFSEIEVPARIAEVEDGRDFVKDAYLQPPRIAAQFALYPMGSSTYTGTIEKVHDNAKSYSCWKGDGMRLCAMLDGEGNDVFDVLRESFAIARADSEHVAMTVTLTANKNAWPEEDRSQPPR